MTLKDAISYGFNNYLESRGRKIKDLVYITKIPTDTWQTLKRGGIQRNLKANMKKLGCRFVIILQKTYGEVRRIELSSERIDIKVGINKLLRGYIISELGGTKRPAGFGRVACIEAFGAGEVTIDKILQGITVSRGEILGEILKSMGWEVTCMIEETKPVKRQEKLLCSRKW